MLKTFPSAVLLILFRKLNREARVAGGVSYASISFLTTEIWDPAYSTTQALWLEPLILHPTPAYGATKHNQSTNLYRKLQRLCKGDGCSLPLISFPAMFLVLSEKHLAFG